MWGELIYGLGVGFGFSVGLTVPLTALSLFAAALVYWGASKQNDLNAMVEKTVNDAVRSRSEAQDELGRKGGKTDA